MPVMITLNKIRAGSTCVDGWEKVLKAHEHLGMDTPFPLSSVLESNNLEDTLWCFEVLPEYIEIPKRFAIWCARDVQHLMEDERSVNAVNVAERYLDGNATLEELKAARAAAATDAATDAAALAARAAVATVATVATAYASYAAAAADAVAVAAALQKQINKLRKMLNEV
jgi:hypothetical protein